MVNPACLAENVPQARRLLIIGASARAAAESAKRAGFDCLAIDLFRDQDLTRACQICLQVVKLELIPQAATPLAADMFMYTGCLENRPRIIEDLAKTFRLAGCELDSLKKVRDPFWLESLGKKNGFQFAPCRRTPPESSELDGPWLRKPILSCGGRQIEFHDPHQRAPGQQSSKVHSWQDDKFFYQKHVAGISVSATFVAGASQTRLLGISRQFVGEADLGARPFSYCGSLGPYSAQNDVANELNGIGRTIAQNAGLVGLFGIDAILAAEGATVIEVNPRYTASMEIIDYAQGISCVEQHIQACLGNAHSSVEERSQKFVCKLIQCSREVQPFHVSSEFTSWALSTNTSEFTCRLADIPADGSEIAVAAPVFSAIAFGESENLALDRAKSLCVAGYELLLKTV